jgi:hypothetical protein
VMRYPFEYPNIGSSDVTQSLGAVAVEGPGLELTDATDICAAATGTLEATGPPITLRYSVASNVKVIR